MIPSCKVWSDLQAMRVEPAGAALSFEQRLAQENGWSLPFSKRVFEEYRRFLYLAYMGGQPVTPSDAVDQAWHLHLAYSRHYWGVLCENILQRPLHHGPTEGGAQEQSRYASQYENTLRLYEETFGEHPPLDLWPATERRLSSRFQRLEVGRHWVIPKTPLIVGFPALALAGCAEVGGEKAAFLIGLAAIAIGAIWLLLSPFPQKKNKNDGGCGTGCGSSSSSNDSDGGCGGGGCGGGCGS